MMTMPVPRLMSAVFWYWARTAPDRAVRALEMHRPTVMVKPVLMEDARTMSGLSPVARMDRPRRVFRKMTMSTAAVREMAAAGTIFIWEPRAVKMVVVRSIFTLEEKPMTARFTVYRPVLVMMPARMEGTRHLVCSNAVMEPAAAPASMAAGSASQG